jgi:transcriptional regulator with XRE-family HTH domain
MTQEGLSDASDIHTTAISRLENGHRNPTWNTLNDLAEGLEVPVWHIAALAELRKDGQQLTDLPLQKPAS